MTELAAQQLTNPAEAPPVLGQRFRGFLPVIVDVETAGFDAKRNALLEVAFIPVVYNAQGLLVPGEPIHAHLAPFEGSVLDQRSLTFIGVDVHSPFRVAIALNEKVFLRQAFKTLNEVRKAQQCTQCVLVGHNAHFDRGFLQAAIERGNLKNQSPFHSFSVLDTVSLSAAKYGQTVLARACAAAGIEFSNAEAHSALYDAQKTAELFCQLVNGIEYVTIESEEQSQT